MNDPTNNLPDYVRKHLIEPSYVQFLEQIERLGFSSEWNPEPLSLEALELAEKTVGLDEVLHAND